MVQVSEKFMKLATDNGRHVYCRIEAGGEVFLDDRLLEFDFDDVVHPDWVTVGTTCANRFHFKARFDGELAVNDEVRPYISFDNEEWCPLGIFYISRRYVRENVISITAYDRLYSLDTEYRYEGALPTTASALLKDICEKAGLEATGYGHDYEVAKLPTVCTMRDMIGYIAGINFTNAKIDRYGRLVLKKPNQNGDHYYIDKKNCMDIRRNMTRSVITSLIVTTEDEVFTIGDGAEISTVEMYNPLVTEQMMTYLGSAFQVTPFYGADIEMQGLPFLEAGEIAAVVDKGLIYFIHLSEIEYHYDGALTATICSKNRTYAETVVHMDDLEELLRRLSLSHSVVCMRSDNAEQIVIDTQPRVVADFTFTTAAEAFAELNISMSLSQNNADGIKFTVYINNSDSGRHIIHTSDESGATLLHLYHLQPSLATGENRIYVTAHTGAGTAYLLPNAMHAGLVIHGGKYDAGDAKDKLSLHDNMTAIKLNELRVVLADISGSVSAEV